METKEFSDKKEKWLKEVADGCHDIAMKDPSYPDFYVFQSLIFEKPDLLILGANPAGDKTYKQALADKSKEKGVDFSRRTKDDLINGENQYLANPDWAISKPVLAMFDEMILRKSVVMNSVYFNTPDISGLSKFQADKKKMIDFSIYKTKEFIYEICKPKTVLFIGMNSPKWMGINFNHKEDTVLRSDDGFLIQEKKIQGIPHFLVHHTSRNYKFNTGTNLSLKREFFRSYLAKIDRS